MFIGFVYMWTHEALSYSRTFVGALGVMPLIVAMLMLAMAGNIFVAFGLLGVFGVVRFRNVLKDTRDTDLYPLGDHGGGGDRHHPVFHRAPWAPWASPPLFFASGSSRLARGGAMTPC